MAMRGLIDAFSAIFRHERPQGDPEHAAFLAEMTERVVATASPKIRAVRGYHKRLLPALDSSSNYFAESIRHFPGPVTLAKHTWNSDPLVNACFASVEQLEGFLRGNADIREAASRTDSREVYFLMTMNRREEVVYGSAMVGEMIRRDVPQDVVTFSDHRCVAPGLTIHETKQQLIRLALELLASLASASILETRKRLEDLERERTSLGYELKILKLKDQGLGSALSRHGEVEKELAEGGMIQKELDAEISRLKSAFSDLEDYLRLVEGIFSRPENMLRFEDMTLEVNRKGVKNYTGADDPSRPIHFAQFSTSERSRAAFLAVSPVKEIIA